MTRRCGCRVRSRGCGTTTRGCRRSRRPPPPSSRSSPSGSSTPSTWTDAHPHIVTRPRTHAHIRQHTQTGWRRRAGRRAEACRTQSARCCRTLRPSPTGFDLQRGRIIGRPLCSPSQDETQGKCVFIRLWQTALYSPIAPRDRCWIDLSLISLCQNLCFCAKCPTRGSSSSSPSSQTSPCHAFSVGVILFRDNLRSIYGLFLCSHIQSLTWVVCAKPNPPQQRVADSHVT